MDKLDCIFALQRALDKKISEERDKTFGPETVKEKLMAIAAEVGEALNETDFKYWRRSRQINAEELSEELVDILHFLISAFEDLGLEADDVFNIYCKKNSINVKRLMA